MDSQKKKRYKSKKKTTQVIQKLLYCFFQEIEKIFEINEKRGEIF
jgi:hypothetical protein